MGDLGATLRVDRRAGSHTSSYFTLANVISFVQVAVHSVEIVFLSYPISHRATLNSFLASLEKVVLRGNGIRQRDLIMPPPTIPSGYAGDKSPLKTTLDSDLGWFYKKSGTRYARLGDLISSGDTVCQLNYRDGTAVFRHGTSHELEPLLKQRGFQISYKENQNSHR